MKVKSDFITNSSTCCYVIAGYALPEDFNLEKEVLGTDEGLHPSEVIDEILKKHHIRADILSGSDDGVPRGYSMIIGRLIADVSDDGMYEMETDSIDLDVVLKFLQELKDLMKLGDDTSPRIYSGLRCC